MLEESVLPREFSCLLQCLPWILLGQVFLLLSFAASMELYVEKGVDSSFEDPLFAAFGLEGVSLKAGANTSVSMHPCRLCWSESLLPGPYECQ